MTATALTLLTTALLLGPAADPPEAKPPALHPNVVQDFFVGDWRATSTLGKNSVVRVRFEWDLHHTILVQRGDHRIDDILGAGLAIHCWDPGTRKILSNIYDTDGNRGDWTYTVEPAGRFFKFTGTFQGVERDKKATAKAVLVVQDENHYTWTISDLVVGGETKPGWELRFTRVAGLPPRPALPLKPIKPLERK